MSPPSKKICSGGGMRKRPSPRLKYRKKLNVFYINITTRQQFFISVSESTENKLKRRFPNFFHIIFKIESLS